jgi:predicted ATPase/class 3 adenylate cyclase
MLTRILPTGTVTFLFTDIEGSTTRWEQHPSTMQHDLQRHDNLLRQAIETNNGHIFKTLGDAFYAAFPTALEALTAILSAHRALKDECWSDAGPLKIRAGLHTGAAQERDGDYFGPTLNRVARLQAAGHGQQTLLSLPTYELVRDHLPAGVDLLDMGEHRLKDLLRPERVFQLLTPGSPTEFPALNTLDNHPNNLPRQATALIGREKELKDVSALLRRTDANLVTLTGPGGTGKTRLSLQAAADMLDHFSGGVWFVELAALTDHSLVASTIAQALGVAEATGLPLIESLKEYLHGMQVLLVLDNFEQVAEAATQVGQLLAAVAGLKMLVTSRVPLRIRGEKEYSVPPLGLPPQGALLPAESLTQYEAVRLFIERATDVKTDFKVTNENAPAVAEICVRLDGLPLAIELAAARVRLFPPQALLGRLSSRLKMLTGGARDISARQQTLRGTIDWSFDLLAEGEQHFFRRIAVFQGGRTLEGLEAVCNADGMLQVDVMEGVESLVSNSLLHQREGSDGEPRFWMLETLHEYAREKLQESGEAAPLHREHALYYMRLAEEAEPHLAGAKQQEWLDRLEDEHDNFRAALRWARAEGESEERPHSVGEAVEIGLRIAVGIWRFWLVRGPYSEGRGALQQLVSQSVRQGNSTARGAKALNGAGVLAFNLGDYSAARALLEEALALGRVAQDKMSISHSLNVLGNLATERGDYPAARSLHEESLALRRELGDQGGIAASLNNLGIVASDQGDYAAAHSFHEQSVVLKREIGDQWGVATSLNNLGLLAAMQGDYPAATSFHEEGLALSKELGYKEGIATYLSSLGNVACEQGDYSTARSLHEEGLALSKELGHKEGIASSLSGLGTISCMQSDYSTARSLHKKSLQIRWEMGEKWGIAESLVGLGVVAVESGQPQRGARLLVASDTLYKAIGAAMEPRVRISYDRALVSARAQLGEASFEKESQEGGAISMEHAIEYALALTLEK